MYSVLVKSRVVIVVVGGSIVVEVNIRIEVFIIVVYICNIDICCLLVSL